MINLLQETLQVLKHHDKTIFDALNGLVITKTNGHVTFKDY